MCQCLYNIQSEIWFSRKHEVDYTIISLIMFLETLQTYFKQRCSFGDFLSLNMSTPPRNETFARESRHYPQKKSVYGVTLTHSFANIITFVLLMNRLFNLNCVVKNYVWVYQFEVPPRDPFMVIVKKWSESIEQHFI